MEFLQYHNSYKHLVGAVNFASDTIKAALLTAHTPNRATHEFFDDVSGDEISGTGYTGGGATLASKTVTVTAANSWATTWATGTAYEVGDIIRPTTGNGFLYQCIIAGTSHAATEPTWSTVFGQVNTDNTVTWENIGVAVTQVDAADPSWGPGATLAAISHVVIYKDTGDPATSPLLGIADLDGPHSVTNGTFSVTVDALGIWTHGHP